jgi:hypothetical protein
VNLVSSTQHEAARKAKRGGLGAHGDPSDDVRAYLRGDYRDRFNYSSWESLYAAVIRGDSRLAELDAYLHGKSAHFDPAFRLS